MPSKHRVKEYAPESYYHIYNRGAEKRVIFADDQDYRMMLHILKRHLSKHVEVDSNGRPYKSFYGKLDLAAYCLMPNHYHILIYQYEHGTMTKFMQSVMVGYSSYFNRKYDRIGKLFQDTYKAIRVENTDYLQYLLAYIHLNPKDHTTNLYTSHPHYQGDYITDWVSVDRVTQLFAHCGGYKEFTAQVSDYRAEIQTIRDQFDFLQERAL